MMLGDKGLWATQFISADERIIERIVFVWPACVKVLSGQPIEDAITIQLVDQLWKDPVIRRICHWVEYQFEPFGTALNGQKFSKGKIDLAFFLEQNRERYLAYECKKLNVQYGGAKKTLAAEYVAEGLMRFLTEQYAEQLPVGGMLGYVMDGQCPSAIKSVQAAIKANTGVNLQGAPVSMGPVPPALRLSTSHLKKTNGSGIEIRHAFLAF